MYRAYFGTQGCGIPSPLEKERWPSRTFSAIEEALVWAERVAKRGVVVVSIDENDGTRLNRTDIASRLGRFLG